MSLVPSNTNPAPPKTFENAMAFVKRARAVLSAEGTPDKFQLFTDYLFQFRQNNITVPELIYACYSLFGNHPNLFLEFLSFAPRRLPPYTAIPPPNTTATNMPPSTDAPPPPTDPIEHPSSPCTDDEDEPTSSD